MIEIAEIDSVAEEMLAKWNIPGLGVVVVKDQNVTHAKGYGFRDVEAGLPFTNRTLFPIASNGKLFTAIAAGMLVEEGRLAYDEPIRNFVPSLRFATEDLDRMVTLRDMLSHRTGVKARDMIWYNSDYSPKDLFERIRFLEPEAPIRHTFIYNNMMYDAVGHIIAIMTGSPWPDFISERIFPGLGMHDSLFDIPVMVTRADFAVPYRENPSTGELRRIPYYVDKRGANASGGIITNLDDMGSWLTALVNDGTFHGRNVIPNTVIEATMQPAIACDLVPSNERKFWEILNQSYGMGRMISSYRGHLMADHGGGIDGFICHAAVFPRENMAVAVFAIGDHCHGLPSGLCFSLAERLLGLSPTPWMARAYARRAELKKEWLAQQSRRPVKDPTGSRPTHDVEAYAGTYRHPAYGDIVIGASNGGLTFAFRDTLLSLSHVDHDRFEAFDERLSWTWSVDFVIGHTKGVTGLHTPLDGGEVVFSRAGFDEAEDV